MVLSAAVFESVLKGLKTDQRSSDSRACARVGIRARVRLTPIVNNVHGTPFLAWLRDISAGGICILNQTLKPGDRFLLELNRDDGNPVHLLCEAVRQCNVERGIILVGARFLGPAEEAPKPQPQRTATAPAAKAAGAPVHSPTPLPATAIPSEAEVRRIRDAVMES